MISNAIEYIMKRKRGKWGEVIEMTLGFNKEMTFELS